MFDYHFAVVLTILSMIDKLTRILKKWTYKVNSLIVNEYVNFAVFDKMHKLFDVIIVGVYKITSVNSTGGGSLLTA